MSKGMKAPDHLCPEHKRIWVGWRDNSYNPRNPTEWPGKAHIMDSRTSHQTRAAEWDRKNRAQMDLVAGVCARGMSPQCDRPAPTGVEAA